MIQIKNLKEVELFGAIVNVVSDANHFTKTISSQLNDTDNVFYAECIRSNYQRLRSYIDNLCTSGRVSFNTAASGLIRSINTFVHQCGDALDAATYSLDRPGIYDDFLELSDLTCEVSGLMAKYDEYVTWFYTTVVNHLTDGSIKPVDPDVDNTDIDNFLNKVSMEEALQDIVDHTPHQDFEAAPATKMSDDEVKNKLQEVADKADVDDDKSLDTISDEDVNKMLIDAADSDKEDDDDPFKDAVDTSDANDDDEDPFKDAIEAIDAESKPAKSETKPKKATKKKQTKTKSSKKS